jgi:hypothetical protein
MGTPAPSLPNVIVAVLFHRNGALIGKTAGQLGVFTCPARFFSARNQDGLIPLRRYFSIRAALLDIF